MPSLKAAYMGGKQAGCIGLLSVYAAGCRPTVVAAYDESVARVAEALSVPVVSSIQDDGFEVATSESDVIICVHGSEIVPHRLLDIPPLGGINVHPCLYRYKGVNPIGRLLEDRNPVASVGVHRMTGRIDEGEVLIEEFVDVNDKRSIEEVYNALYPHYAVALLKALTKIRPRGT